MESESPTNIDYNSEDAETNFCGYEDYLRCEPPPLVRRQLEQEMDHEFGVLELRTKRMVIKIAQKLQVILFRKFQQLQKQERGLKYQFSVDVSNSQTVGSTFSATDTPSSIVTTSSPTLQIPDPLGIFDDHANPDSDVNFDFNTD